jgi:hypothetical protein
MFVRITLAVCVLMILAVVPAFAAAGDGSGVCENRKWTGAYVRPSDIGIGKLYSTQLNFDKDGTASLFSTYYPEQMITYGASTTAYGAWNCRADGKIVMTALYADFEPNGAGDLTLAAHHRATLLFEIVDGNTLKLIAYAYRSYGPTEDPTDPAGGNLGPTSTVEWLYTRFTVSEGDLQ